jgi:hypothetical protein
MTQYTEKTYWMGYNWTLDGEGIIQKHIELPVPLSFRLRGIRMEIDPTTVDWTYQNTFSISTGDQHWGNNAGLSFHRREPRVLQLDSELLADSGPCILELNLKAAQSKYPKIRAMIELCVI